MPKREERFLKHSFTHLGSIEMNSAPLPASPSSTLTKCSESSCETESSGKGVRTRGKSRHRASAGSKHLRAEIFRGVRPANSYQIADTQFEIFAPLHSVAHKEIVITTYGLGLVEQMHPLLERLREAASVIFIVGYTKSTHDLAVLKRTLRAYQQYGFYLKVWPNYHAKSGKSETCYIVVHKTSLQVLDPTIWSDQPTPDLKPISDPPSPSLLRFPLLPNLNSFQNIQCHE